MEIHVDARELLNWSRKLGDEAIKDTKANIARALNQLGRQVEDTIAEHIASGQGMSASEVRKLFDIKRASAGDLFWELDATRVMDTGVGMRLPAGRELPRFPAMPTGLLVNIITAGDVMQEIMGEGAGSVSKRLVQVCDICLEAADKGPYTIEEVRAMGARWEGFSASSPGVTNLLHPNCRCTVWPLNKKWKDVRVGGGRADLTATRGKVPKVSPFEGGAVPELISFDEFARRIVEAADGAIMKVLK